jgi:hypothetical protein
MLRVFLEEVTVCSSRVTTVFVTGVGGNSNPFASGRFVPPPIWNATAKKKRRLHCDRKRGLQDSALYFVEPPLSVF